jgi:aryl-alcohol dehydrogenase-like predicted oxidoreductase
VDRGRIILGTAQLGSAYGIANSLGQPDDDGVVSIVRAATKSGITGFDTAAAYGTSERRLGEALARLGLNRAVKVTSKGSIEGRHAWQLQDIVGTSLRDLRLEQLDSWLLHREDEIRGWSASFREEARKLLERGCVGSFGVSVYSLDAALVALHEGCFDTIQCPANPFDRRFLRSGALEQFVKIGGRVALRSIYLQGLCLMNPADVPDGVEHGKRAVTLLRDFCAGHRVNRDEFCLHYVLHRSSHLRAGIIVGCESAKQLVRNVEMFERSSLYPALFEEWDRLWPEDLEPLISPFAWNLAEK